MPNYKVKSIEAIAIGSDVQARIFTLARGDVIPWHYHSETTDHYAVLRGALTIETRDPANHAVLTAGERYRIFPGTPHRISNESADECEFVLVQGVGTFDWHKAEPAAMPPR